MLHIVALMVNFWDQHYTHKVSTVQERKRSKADGGTITEYLKKPSYVSASSDQAAKKTESRRMNN